MTRKVNIFALLTSNYHGKNIEKLMAIVSREIEELRTTAEELSLQGSIFDSTWGLAMWERELSIIPHQNMSVEQRKQKIYSHINTYVPSTKQQIIDAIKVYGYAADVIEHIDTFFVELILKVKGVLMFPIDDILADVDNILPAHLDYSFYINYNYEIGIKSYTKSYVFEYDLCGTKPDIATIGAINTIETITESQTHKYMFDNINTGVERTGLIPDISIIGQIDTSEILAENRIDKYLFKNISAGIEIIGVNPNPKTLGNMTNVKISSNGIKMNKYSVDYELCGTEYTGER